MSDGGERKKYDVCIRSVDGQVEQLINFLERQGLRQSTVIILTADHGEAFGTWNTSSSKDSL
ncbi:MAG: sulfatase-like hydrolase/transferase [bacterium]